MIDRTHLRNFLNSIPGLEGWSDSVEHLNGVEMMLNVLAEPTPGMIEAVTRLRFEEGSLSIYEAEEVWGVLWSARFRGE